MPKKRPYDQHCPIARALDLVGDRWSLLIVRELFLGAARYGELLAALETISTDVLAKRLRELAATGLVEPQDDGRYALTAHGRSLAPVLQALGQWGRPLLAPPDGEDELTAARALLMLVIPSAGIDLGTEQTTELRVGDQVFTVTSSSDGLIARRGPAADADAVVTTDGLTLWAIGFDQLSWADAVASGALSVDGNPAAAEQLLAGRPTASVQTANT